LNASSEEIKVMKKSELKKIMKKLVSDTAFERLQKIKENHTEVMKVKHYKLKMQKYLKASQYNLKQEVAQIRFNLRSRMTTVNNNYRESYATFECEAYKENEESQLHSECKEIDKLIKEYRKPLEYNKLFNKLSTLA
jgi:hypothetical protein